MRWCFLTISVLIFFSCQTKKVQSPQSGAKKSYQFPKDWVGEYTGTLLIESLGKPNKEVPMGLVIQPTEKDSIYIWQLIYGENKIKGLRDYRLIIKEPENGIYAIDEQNSIVLDAYLLGNQLSTRFSVGKAVLSATYQKSNEGIFFEILQGDSSPIHITGGIDSIPKVESYPIKGKQTALLRKKG